MAENGFRLTVEKTLSELHTSPNRQPILVKTSKWNLTKALVELSDIAKTDPELLIPATWVLCYLAILHEGSSYVLNTINELADHHNVMVSLAMQSAMADVVRGYKRGKQDVRYA